MAFSEKLRKIREDRNLSQADVARMVGYTPEAIYHWERGTNPRMSTVRKLAKALNVSVTELLDEDGFGVQPEPSEATLPVMRLGYVHAGDPEEGIEDIEMIQAPADVVSRHRSARFLEVKGDCMDLVYPEGCMILIDPELPLRNGNCVVADMGGGEYVLRRYHRFRDTLVLSSESHSASYPDIVVTDPTREVRFLGTVVWFQAKEDVV